VDLEILVPFAARRHSRKLGEGVETRVMPSNVADVAGLIASAMSTVREIK
jgi:hypothetical protein